MIAFSYAKAGKQTNGTELDSWNERFFVEFIACTAHGNGRTHGCGRDEAYIRYGGIGLLSGLCGSNTVF